MAGTKETFYTSRPGLDQGRIAPSNFDPPEGDYVFCCGSDTPGRYAWLKAGDKFEVYQADSPDAAAKILRFVGKWRGPVSAMPAVTAEVGPPNFYTLSDGETLFLDIDESEIPQVITFNAASFVDITKARPAEVVDVINASLTGAVASLTGRGALQVRSLGSGRRARVRVVGGTATALDMTELAWKFSIFIDSSGGGEGIPFAGDEHSSRILRTGEDQDLSDMGANITSYVPPIEIHFRLEVVEI